jgi:cyclase
MPAPADPHYRFEPLTEGALAGIVRRGGHAICNSGVVDLGPGAIVFDTGMTSHSARALRAGAELHLGHGPTVVANSHWHLDHQLGNQAFDGLPIFGTTRTREIMLARRDELLAEIRREAIEKDLHELEARRDTLSAPGAREDVEFLLEIHRALLAQQEPIRWTPPDRTFEQRLALPGARGAELLSFGSGHTDADAVLHLPRERLLFAGDLVVIGAQPSVGSGDPQHWLTVLDELERLRPERIVPGHGPVVTVDGIGETRAYLEGVLEAAARPAGAPLLPGVRRWEGSLSLEENVRAVRSRGGR